MSIEGQGHFFTIYFPGFVCLFFTRSRYQVSVYRTNGPLVFKKGLNGKIVDLSLFCVFLFLVYSYVLRSSALVSFSRDIPKK